MQSPGGGEPLLEASRGQGQPLLMPEMLWVRPLCFHKASAHDLEQAPSATAWPASALSFECVLSGCAELPVFYPTQDHLQLRTLPGSGESQIRATHGKQSSKERAGLASWVVKTELDSLIVINVCAEYWLGRAYTCHSDLAGPLLPTVRLPPTPNVTALAIEPAGPEESWGVHGAVSFHHISLSSACLRAGLAVFQALLSVLQGSRGWAGRKRETRSKPSYLSSVPRDLRDLDAQGLSSREWGALRVRLRLA